MAFIPSENGPNSLSRIAFFFLPMARRSRSALSQRVPGHLLRDRHDLFLVDDHAVRVVQDLGQRLGQFGVDRARPACARSCGRRSRCARWRPSGPAGTAPAPRRCPRSCPGPSIAAAPASDRRPAGTRRGCRRGPAVRRWPGCPAAGAPGPGRSPVFALMYLRQSSMTVRVRSPRKSILSRPERLAGAHVELRDDRAVGVAAPDRDDVRRAAPWTGSRRRRARPTCRFRPSSPRAVSTTSRTSGSAAYRSRNSPASL